MKLIDNGVLYESTGRDEYVYSGIVGLGPDGGVYGGYDDFIGHFSTLDPQERKELAQFMIDQWTKVRDA